MFGGVSGTPVTNNFKKDNLQQALISYGVWGWHGPGYRVTPFKVILYNLKCYILCVYKYVKKPSRVVGFHMAFSRGCLVLVTLPHSYPASCSPANLALPVPSISLFSPSTLYSSLEVPQGSLFSGCCGYSNLNTLIKNIQMYHSHRRKNMWLIFFWVWITSHWYWFWSFMHIG